jgi:hypothetical protein
VAASMKCSVEGCDKNVSRKGYSLCYEHWLQNQSAAETNTENSQSDAAGRLTATELGEKLNLSSSKLNRVFSELGWIQKDRKGWVATEQGKKLLAIDKTHHKTGIPFVVWPEAIITSRILKNSISELSAVKETTAVISDIKQTASGFRERHLPTHRTMDGHWVRSKAEALIDNWLYMSEVVHAYERSLPVEEELYCDFYIPEGKVYIEYWGLETEPKYQVRKQQKLEIYKKYGFNLIELNDDHVKNLDDHLPKLLLKFNVIVS